MKKQQQKSLQHQKKLKQFQQSRNFSFTEMKQHQKKYDQYRKTKNQEKQQLLKQSKTSTNQFKYPCLFLESIKQEEQRQKKMQQEKKQMVKTFVQKRISYAQNVRKILHQNKKQIPPEAKAMVQKQGIQSLNTPQKYKIGTSYMRQVNINISKLPRKLDNPSIKQKQQPKPLSKLYKNYLKQIKHQNLLSNQCNINRTQMNKSIKSNKQSLHDMLIETKKYSYKQNLITSKDLVDSVKNKLAILKKYRILIRVTEKNYEYI